MQIKSTTINGFFNPDKRVLSCNCNLLDAHTEKIGIAKFASEVPPHFSETDALTTETQTSLFIKHCILPVAMKARALIIITATNDCSLSIAVSKIMGPIQKRMGSRCPFTIIGYSTGT